MRTRLSACIFAMSLSACSTMYKPLEVDAKTGNYPTSVQVDPGGIAVFDTSANPKAYKHVLLLANSNVRPSVFAFSVRTALAQAGLVRVHTANEFLSLARDRGISAGATQLNADMVRRFATEFGSVLVVDFSYEFVGNSRYYSRLSVTDAASGRALLRVDHPRSIWVDHDTEALYPVLNQLRKWAVDSGRKV